MCKAEVDAEYGFWQVTGSQGPRRQMWMPKGKGIVDEKNRFCGILGPENDNASSGTRIGRLTSLA